MHLNFWKTLLIIPGALLLLGALSAEPPARSESAPVEAPPTKSGTEAKKEELAKSPGIIALIIKDRDIDQVAQVTKWRFTMARFPDPKSVEGGMVEVEIATDDLTSGRGKTVDRDFKELVFGSSDVEKVSIQIASPRLLGEDKDGRSKYAAEGLLFAEGMIKPLPVEFTVLERNPLKVQGKIRLQGEQFKLYTQKDDLTENAFMDVRFETLVPEKVVFRQTRRDFPGAGSLPQVGPRAVREPEAEAPAAPAENQKKEVKE